MSNILACNHGIMQIEDNNESSLLAIKFELVGILKVKPLSCG